ncbi:hypothetical protein F8M41_002560 [Gigaspora margarita]|uniref:Uncharacterized protein n=1 Tax=Gigaspora margarita TaxID=4874 RepID=A0A8H4AYG4_GIGMA|nr:hypothetical protein F8M41_002560 [Gigaspora margarita]
MSGKKNSELRDIIKSSKTKRELIFKLSRQKPEYLIENLSSIERVAELIYDKKNISKRKRDVVSESEESDEEEINVTTEKKKKPLKKLTKYQKFVQEEHPKLKDEYNNEDIFKAPTNVKRIKGDTCSVGFCGDKAKEHICRFEREIGVQLEMITFGPRVDFDTIWQRLFYTRLFQTNTDPFNNLELHDITIHLKLTTYHTPARGNTHNLPTKQGFEKNSVQRIGQVTIKANFDC